jgi:putative ABC transport system permease protein
MLSGSLLRSAPLLLSPFCALSAHLRIAAGQLKRLTGRHRLTVAGMVAAIGMAAGMDILIHSFEQTVTNWIGHTLKADLFVAVKGVENASNRNKMSEKTWKSLKNDPNVESADIGHIMPISFKGAPTFLVGMRSEREWDGNQFIWIEAPDKKIHRSQPDATGIYPAIISESFSQRYALRSGDTLELPTPDGLKTLRVNGLFADYGNERGSLVVDSDLVCDWFNDRRALNFAATLKPGVDPEEVRNQWSKDYPSLTVRTNRALRAEVITIFNQTFAVTHALKAIGILVAIAGLALALFSLVMERRRELQVQREIGFSRRDIASSLTIEGLFMSLYGLLGGLIISIWLGYILVFVINKQSFGWTLAFGLPASNLWLLSAGIIVASLVTCYSVGYWSSTLEADKEV